MTLGGLVPEGPSAQRDGRVPETAFRPERAEARNALDDLGSWDVFVYRGRQ